ncbi:MAG TPA: hypothetical protein DIU15_10380, partial [Deltaproteobacteria bacterium]|nr:hypothetical protein [Deltaproteobacteria bacterium]
FVDGCLPVTTSAPALAPHWDDLNPASSMLPLDGIFAWHDTTAGNDRFIVSWENIGHFGFSLFVDGITFQVHLYPGGDIEFHYDDLSFGDVTIDNAVSATIGIQDVEGSADPDPLEYSCEVAQPALEGIG